MPSQIRFQLSVVQLSVVQSLGAHLPLARQAMKFLAVCTTVAFLYGCGQRGPLYFPEPAKASEEATEKASNTAPAPESMTPESPAPESVDEKTGLKSSRI